MMKLSSVAFALVGLLGVAAACGRAAAHNKTGNVPLDVADANDAGYDVTDGGTLTDGGAVPTMNFNISNLLPDAGPVLCALYAAPGDGFPGDPSKAVATRIVPAGSFTTALCRFESLPAGEYAMSYFQDENGNGKLDTGVLGIPTEGIGISNNDTPAMSAPVWNDAKFQYAGGLFVQDLITKRYF